MKKNVLIFGAVLGTILAGHMVYMVNLVYNNPDINSNDVLGYIVLALIFSLVYFGTWNYMLEKLNSLFLTKK